MNESYWWLGREVKDFLGALVVVVFGIVVGSLDWDCLAEEWFGTAVDHFLISWVAEEVLRLVVSWLVEGSQELNWISSFFVGFCAFIHWILLHIHIGIG